MIHRAETFVPAFVASLRVGYCQLQQLTLSSCAIPFLENVVPYHPLELYQKRTL